MKICYTTINKALNFPCLHTPQPPLDLRSTVTRNLRFLRPTKGAWYQEKEKVKEGEKRILVDGKDDAMVIKRSFSPFQWLLRVSPFEDYEVISSLSKGRHMKISTTPINKALNFFNFQTSPKTRGRKREKWMWKENVVCGGSPSFSDVGFYNYLESLSRLLKHSIGSKSWSYLQTLKAGQSSQPGTLLTGTSEK